MHKGVLKKFPRPLRINRTNSLSTYFYRYNYFMTHPNIQQIQDRTKTLLAKATSDDITQEDIVVLRSILRFHEHRYYMLNDPLISDFEYDILFKNLEKLETENPDLIVPDSPTQRVGKGLTKE